MKIVLENKGIKTDTYYIPPFTLYEGEIIVLYLYNGTHFYDTEMYLKDIFCGKRKHENVIIHKKMTFVDHFKKSNLKDVFFTPRISRYLKKDSDFANPFLAKVFENKYFTKKTPMNKVPGTPRKLLALYAVLYKTKDIIFDVAGLDCQGTELTFKLVDEEAKNGGSAILLTAFDNLREHASKFISIEWNDGSLPLQEKIKIDFK
ncbi:hypothetical protein [Flavobacterium defluvii]|uniref:Uncharacterized protein n=1 Tax=Flavobacterium defluvii TaxID=370979 RepID=A0A1M5QXC9_9FLAO|nr:hypothetical protein [Flavobacterium defluvii]SHH18410.1 hypothetical protein SAMN05443663_10638 [Flavobacterium defluvii]